MDPGVPARYRSSCTPVPVHPVDFCEYPPVTCAETTRKESRSMLETIATYSLLGLLFIMSIAKVLLQAGR